MAALVSFIEKTVPEQEHTAGKLAKIEYHLKVVNWVENFLKIRDTLLSGKKYIGTDRQKNIELSKQFPNVANIIKFYEKIYDKIESDNLLDYSDFSINSFLDCANLQNKPTITYIHFNLREHMSKIELNDSLTNLLKQIGSQPTQILYFTINNLTDLPIEDSGNYNTFSRELSKRFDREIKLFNLSIFNGKATNYKTGFFGHNPNENSIYTINRIMTARRVLLDMIKVRGYKGQFGYIYTDYLSGKFGHFLMNLEERFNLGLNQNLDLRERNYFDIYGLTTTTPKNVLVHVYFHFILTGGVTDYQGYLETFDVKVRQLLGISADQKLHIILVVNKKQTSKNMIEKINLEITKSLSSDIILLDNLMYNPVDNVNQPKFRLIRRNTDEHNRIISHLGTFDDIPRMKLFDPVNRFFGGDAHDLYEIIRSNVITIKDDRHHLLHIDPEYRIVK